MFDLIPHLCRQIAFSRATFGPSERREGVLDHMTKEIQEVRDGDGDPDEWIDLVILAFDGLWRSLSARHPDKRAFWIAQNIVERLTFKQERNEFRDWPDWRGAPEDKAIEHDRSGEVQNPTAVVDLSVIPAGWWLHGLFHNHTPVRHKGDQHVPIDEYTSPGKPFTVNLQHRHGGKLTTGNGMTPNLALLEAVEAVKKNWPSTLDTAQLIKEQG